MKKIVIIIGLLFIIVIGVLYLNYLSSTITVTIQTKNTKTVEVISDDSNSKPHTIAGNPATVRLVKNHNYIVMYTGADGYTDGSVPIDKDGGTVTIDPDYSSSKYAALMAAALPIATKVVTVTYPKASTLYTITPLAMKDKGNWYLLKLSYTGNLDNPNSDTLYTLLQKSGDTWKIAAAPSIIFTQKNTPSVSGDTLSWADSQH